MQTTDFYYFFHSEFQVIVNIVILAAGSGTRMRSTMPKVLQPLAGSPLLAHVLETARALNPRRLIVVTGYNAPVVEKAVAAPDVLFARQEQQLGTGHAVLQALPFVDQQAPTLVLYGDVPLTSVATLQKLVRKAGTNRYGILTVNLEDPTGYGRIVRNEMGEVVRIVEHKDATQAELSIGEINTGIMAIPAGKLSAWLHALNNHNKQNEYYLTDIVAYARADDVEVVTEQPAHAWETLGVNTQMQLAELERIYQHNLAAALLEQGVKLADPARIDIRGTLECEQEVAIDVNCVFEGQVVLKEGVRIGPNCVLKNVVVDSNAVIHAFSHIEGAHIGTCAIVGPYARLRPGTDLGPEVRIGNFVEVKQAVIGHASKVNHLAYVGDAHIGARVNLGAGVITCNYDGKQKHQTRIEDDVFVGSDSQLIAPLTIGQGAKVAAGTTLWKDVCAKVLVKNPKTQHETP